MQHLGSPSPVACQQRGTRFTTLPVQALLGWQLKFCPAGAVYSRAVCIMGCL